MQKSFKLKLKEKRDCCKIDIKLSFDNIVLR